MPPMGFEPTTSAAKRPQTYALSLGQAQLKLWANMN